LGGARAPPSLHVGPPLLLALGVYCFRCRLFWIFLPINLTHLAGVVQGWAAILMGIISGSIPWYTMMVLHKKVNFLRHVDDPMAVFHTHAVAGSLGGIMTGFLAVPKLCRMFYMVPDWEKYIGLAYGLQNGRVSAGLRQMGIQLGGIIFVVCLNVVTTSLICLLIRFIVPLRLEDDELQIGDNAIHGEEAFALQAERERFLDPKINTFFDAQEFSSTASSYIGELQMV
jgi:Amt family ammonium transporter